MNEIISVKNLIKEYSQGENIVRALDGLDLSITSGSMLAIMGASGSGKTTLLNVLTGLDSPTMGSIYIDNKELTKMDDVQKTEFRREKIGIIFQSFNLIPSLTVYENVVLPFRICKKSYKEELVLDVLEQLGLKKKANVLPRYLSGGEQQRTAIARVVLSKPDILFADEPTGNLDSKNTKNVIGLLKEYCKKYKKTVIIITHNSNVANECDYTIEIEDGKILNTTKEII